MERSRPAWCWDATRFQLSFDSVSAGRRAARCSYRQQKRAEARVQSGAVGMMEHVVCVGVRVMGVHVRVHLVYVRVSCSTLRSQAVVPRVSKNSGRRQAVAAPEASVCRVEGSGVGEVRVSLRWVAATPQGRR